MINYKNFGIVGVIGCIISLVCAEIFSFVGMDNVPMILRVSTLIAVLLSLISLDIWFFCFTREIQDKLYERLGINEILGGAK